MWDVKATLEQAGPSAELTKYREKTRGGGGFIFKMLQKLFYYKGTWLNR